MANSSRIMHHVTKLKSSQTGFLNMTMSLLYSNGLHSHQISIQQSTFGMWWNGRFASRMCSWQICSNCVMLSCQYGPKSLRNVSNTLLNLFHEELRQFWRQKWVQPGTNKVYLIKWSVSVYIYIYIYIYTHVCVYVYVYKLNLKLIHNTCIYIYIYILFYIINIIKKYILIKQ